MLLGNGKTDAGFGVGKLAVEHFDKEKAAPAFLALAHSKKLRPAFQPPDSFFWSIVRHSPAIAIGQRGLRPTDACGRGRGERTGPSGRPWCPYVHGTRAGACGQAWMVDRYAS